MAKQFSQTDVRAFHEHGFLLIPGMFDHEEIRIIRDELPGLFQEDSPRRILEGNGAVRTFFATNHPNPVLQTLSRLSRIVDNVRMLLGSDVYVHQYKINRKAGMLGDWWEWHQDYLYWHREDGLPSPNVLSVAIYMDEVNEFNGPLLFIPGSHKSGMMNVEKGRVFEKTDFDQHSPRYMSTLTGDLKYKVDPCYLRELVDQKGIASAKGPAGSLLLFHGNLFHGSSNNMSPFDRTMVFISYNLASNPPVKRAVPRPDFISNLDPTPINPVPDSSLKALSSMRAVKAQ